MTMGIAEFIEAQLRDADGYAREALKACAPTWEEPWSGEVNVGLSDEAKADGVTGIEALIDCRDSRISRFIARQDPKAVLAEIAAKREMLRLWQRMDASDGYEASSFAQELVDLLLAPYGKRAVFTRTGSSGPLSWQLEDLPEEVTSDGV